MTETLVTHRCTVCLTTMCNPILPFCPTCGHGLSPYEVTLEDNHD